MSRKTLSPAIFAQRALLTAATLCALAAAGAFAFATTKAALSIAAGGGIAMASFIVLAFVIVRSAGGKSGAGWVAALGMVKMGVLGGIIWWLMSRGIVEPLAFLGGFSTMVAALLIEGIRVK